MESTDMIDKQALLNERQTQVSFTTSIIKAYRSVYNVGEEIEISLPPSRQMVNVADLQVFFRPHVSYKDETGLGLSKFQSAQRCITAIDASVHLSVNSVTINNHQVLANPRQNTSFARTILEQYMRSFIKSKPVDHLSSDGQYLTANVMFQSGSGANTYSVLENATTIGANGLFIRPLFTQGDVVGDTVGLITKKDIAGLTSRGQNSSLFEQSFQPKAITSQMYQYYYPANITPKDNDTAFGCEYYEQGISTHLMAKIAGTTIPANLEELTFPLLTRCVTPSISVYRKQQEQFLRYRSRFFQTIIGSYADETQKPEQSARTLTIDQHNGWANFAKTDLNLGVEEGKGPDELVPKTLIADVEGTGKPTKCLQVEQVRCRFAYGLPVQQYDGDSNDTSRFKGVEWSSSDSTFLNSEKYTTVSVRIGDICPELENIGLMCLEKSRVDISLVVNPNAAALSAYIQPSLNLDPFNSYGNAAQNGGAQPVTGTPDGYLNFLKACKIGDGVKLTLNDIMIRIETHNYSSRAYSVVKEILNQPKPYMSFRFAQKTIQSSGHMSIPVNLGVSSSVRALMYWIVPRSGEFIAGASQKRTGKYNNKALPQDSMIDYQSCQPIPRGDLRSTILDSYYIPHESYCNIDNERFNTTQLPLNDPEMSQYLLTQSGLYTSMQRYVNLDLQSFTLNRYFGVIPIDSTGTRKFISQLCDFNIVFNDADRVAHSKRFNHHGQSIANQFEVIVVAIIGQSVHECQRVVV